METVNYLEPNQIYLGECRQLLRRVYPESVACSVWSPPYYVGKDYESYLSYEEWLVLLEETIAAHYLPLKPGGFLAINIADILCFKDANMPKIQAETIKRRKINITKEQILEAKNQYPDFSRYQIGKLLGCSEQTIDRRLNGNNIRGGKYATQTRVKLTGNLLEKFASQAGLYLYDRRIWVKDAAWENSKWHSLSYRSVDEFEYVYIFWKPGVTVVNRDRLTPEEWSNWGSRSVWNIPSVRANNDHEAKFPMELPKRIIRLLSDPGELILDCFIGSGTTALAALSENRRFIGIDKEPKYVDLASKACVNFMNLQDASKSIRGIPFVHIEKREATLNIDFKRKNNAS